LLAQGHRGFAAAPVADDKLALDGPHADDRG
jgi:hypothetical protein